MNDRITFNEVISRRSAYGLIWSGTFDRKPCVIKMVMLTSGLHYNKDKDGYRNGQTEKIRSSPPNIFTRNGRPPFYHQEFRHRRAMKTTDFIDEAKKLIHMSKLGLAPKVYGHGICDKLFPVHYGFIVMERMDASVKDILLKRDLGKDELRTIFRTVDSMHKEHAITHGDMKPSNIGVNLDKYGRIARCLVFDCHKVRYRDDMTQSEFERRVRKDVGVFHRHVKMNVKDRT